ncbi:MAG TPA: TolC family protein [bacterium]|nr:MAG: Outer membrane efflux protein [bacterium ADurb.Bin236]HOY62579.1 TolC family protein [bacterium]HPI75388.1 TolC family protein [bacterium]
MIIERRECAVSRGRLAAVAAVALACAIFAGEAGAAELLTLERCEAEAAANNPGLKAAEKGRTAAEWRRAEAKSARLPKFTLSGSAVSTDNPTISFMSVLNQERFDPAMMGSINDPGATANFNARFGFEIPLSAGGAIRHGIRAARAAAGAAAHSEEDARRRARRSARAAYFGAVVAEEKTEAAGAALEAARAHAALAASMRDAGLTVESDSLSAAARLAEMEELKLTADNEAALAKAELLMAMGAYQGREIEVDRSALERVEFDGALEEYIESAMKNRPDLKAIEEAVKAASEAERIEAAAGRPTVGAAAHADVDRRRIGSGGGESWFAGVAANFSVYDGGRAGARRAAARAERERLEWALEQARQAAEMETRRAYYGASAAKKKMDAAARAVEQAEAAARIVNNRYANGLAVSVEVLSAEAELTRAKLRRLAALSEFVVGVETLALAAGK